MQNKSPYSNSGVVFTKFDLLKIEIVIISFCFLIAIAVIVGWYFDIHELLSLTPKGATMKFNTALIFLLSGILLIPRKKKRKGFLILSRLTAFILILIGIITLSEYLGWIFFSIDNIFVEDLFSKSNPGRMSPATAICSILLGFGFLGNQSSNGILRKMGLFSFKLIALLSLLSIISFILLIPLANKTSLFQTMAIHTSALFLLISSLQILKNPNSAIHQVLIKDFAGSKLTLKILPLIVLFPIISSYLIIVGIHQNIITIEFGLVANAAVFIPLSIIYLTYIAMGLNKTDEERQQLEIKLREGNRYLKRFKQGVDQVAIVALTDKRGVITYVNDTFCKISQYEKEELIGKTHSIVNAGYHDKKFFANLWKTISSGEIWVDEIKNKAKDGSFYWVLTAIVPFKNEEGDITEFMALRQDVTERKKTEELRLAHLLKLEYKNKELEQFAYVASHDLQEPLRTIINFTDLLSKKKKDHFDEVSLKSLQFIQEATVRMSQLINSLLDYNRIDNDNNLTLVDCNELIHEIEIELSKEIIDTETTIIVQKLPTITGYEPPLKMLFQNLISNAIKFRKEGIKPLIRISAIQNDIGWLFSIKDNGIGISTKHYEKIFVIFQQLHNKNKYEGSGIGLSHCRKIVDLHGGKIWVDSKLNEGSIFNFTISTQSHEKKS
tara:strand:- start:419018 stop:421018 length:2001 start_codon:yes stop_codon:yes gene_type:complete